MMSRIQSNPVYNSLCQSVRYLPKIRPLVSQYLVPSYGVTNPNLDPFQPNRHFRRYLQCTFIVTQLRCDVWYTQSTPTVSGSYRISWSKEEILDIGKALAKRTTRSCAMLRIGSCPSHHSPNDVIPLSTTYKCPQSGNHDHLLINELVNQRLTRDVLWSMYSHVYYDFRIIQLQHE